MPWLWEVVSVVNQFSNVSKVNTLSNTQVCKCFHYNTGFFLFIWQRMHAAWEQTAASQHWALRVPKRQPPSLGFWGWWQHKSTSHWGLGLHLMGQWTAAEAAMPCHSDPAPLTPPLSLHFSWYQQTKLWNTIESTGEVLWTANMKCAYCFPPFHHLSEGPQNPR